MYRYILYNLACALVATFGASGCIKTKSNVTIAFSVRDNSDKRLQDAKIIIDKVNVGVTDENGKFVFNGKYFPNDKVQVEVQKIADDFYFAPYIKVFRIGDEPVQKLFVDASLYAVLKPKPGAAVETADSAVAPNSASDVKAKDTEIKTESSSEQPLEKSIAKNSDAKPLESADNINMATETPSVTTSAQQVTKFMTFHAYSQSKPIANVYVYRADSQQKSLDRLCVTNARGRCAAKVVFGEGDLDFLAKSDEFATRVISVKRDDANIVRFGLKKSSTLEIFVNRHSNFNTFALPQVQVMVSGKEVGRTNDYGFFIFPYNGKPTDMLTVTLVPPSREYTEESFETDFVVSGPMRLEKTFFDKKADIQRWLVELPQKSDTTLQSFVSLITTAPSQPNGLTIQLAQQLERADKREFGEIKLEVNGKKIKLIASHPIGINYERNFDATKASNKSTAQDIITSIRNDLYKLYPYKGYLLKVDKEIATINLGSKSNAGMEIGQRFDVYGMQRDRFGRSQYSTKIAELVIKQVNELTSLGKLEKVESRALLSAGDQVVRQFGIKAAAQKNSTTQEKM